MERSSGELMFSLSDLSDFVKVCSKNGVKRAEIHGIVLEFGEKERETQKVYTHGSSVMPSVSPDVEKQLEEIRKESYIEQLKAFDPLKYEELVMSGEIEDVQDEQVNIRTE